eukprot:TRINITY_DN1203_c0_g1::TRINITY_DN1203_c0_g1_i1::g.26923::m.26923 TRINITY_DN1203_c0_g1::TRINITY_DN1203_c0_g1_i1::g.26923  ORF type:complete len:117 (-),score=-16.87,fn2/PF00040.14/0.094 TRINITY_DN1203_c0_g1_i1:92-442(-)
MSYFTGFNIVLKSILADNDIFSRASLSHHMEMREYWRKLTMLGASGEGHIKFDPKLDQDRAEEGLLRHPTSGECSGSSVFRSAHSSPRPSGRFGNQPFLSKKRWYRSCTETHSKRR